MALRAGPMGTTNTTPGTYPTWRDDELLAWERDFLTAGIIQGIGGALAVTQRGAGANMSVDVAAGRAIIQFTNTVLNPNKTYKTWFDSDSVVNVPISTADATNPRKDIIIAKIDGSVAPNAGAANNCSITVVAGTPAGSPSAPAVPSGAILLATVNVAAGATSIVNANITDGRSYVQIGASVLADLFRSSAFTSFLNSLASSNVNEGASLVGIRDVANNFAATNVESALAELFSALPVSAPDGSGMARMETRLSQETSR